MEIFVKQDENQPAKLSYAQMVKAAKAQRSPDGDCRSDESDRETDKATNANTQPKQALREIVQTSPGQSPTRADANHNVKEEPRDQRARAGRRMKENRDMYRERRRERERDIPVKSNAK